MREIKYRKAYFQIEKALETFRVVILLGLRKTGKTTILKQLAANHNGYYIDFRDSKEPERDYNRIFAAESGLILLDEVGYLPDFDVYFETLLTDLDEAGKRLVLTGSAYGMLKQICRERLGGGRAHMAELFPLSFEEYLYFSGRIARYGTDYEPDEEDVQNFYRLYNVPNGLDFILDEEYMLSVFSDVEAARANQQYAIRDVYLTDTLYRSVVDIFAYTLNENVNALKFGKVRVGRSEFGRTAETFDLSESLIKYASLGVANISFAELGLVIAYLLHSGYLFVDLKVTAAETQSSDSLVTFLSGVRTQQELVNILRTYTLSVISPLLYTRLLVNLEKLAGQLYTNKALTGKLFELAVKSEDFYRNSFVLMRNSYKYLADNCEVDLCSKHLLLEAAIGYKGDNAHYVDKVLTDKSLIRVLTDEPGVFENTGKFYRIGYPKALLMLSNGAIYNLDRTRISYARGC
ncbi:MAG: AAA family ATPase [Clostridiales bacterium]|jgi:predicted AAA+ superfamily ATPase|nr:AAA family ATPase [Clostridiales bacterium]